MTGVLSRKREDIHAELRAAGARVDDGVKKDTTYLVAGDKTGKAKLDQAKKSGTKVITEAQMEALLRGETLPPSPAAHGTPRLKMRGMERMDKVRMTSPKIEPTAVVVPFGVPDERKGLGLGLAALVHGFARLHGESVALAQIFGKRQDQPDAAPGPVEAFIPPNAWRDLAGQGSAPADVKIVLTGSFEPPDGGGGRFDCSRSTRATARCARRSTCTSTATARAKRSSMPCRRCAPGSAARPAS